MCMMCDGADLDDVLFHIDGQVTRNGWALVPVDGGAHRPSWIYTIGLTDQDHPELVMAGVDLDFSVAVLDYLADRVWCGERLDTRQHVRCVETFDVELADVHPAHVERGLINMWRVYYQALGPPVPEPWVRQVILPDDNCCAEHQGSQLRLDDAADMIGFRSLNRAELRARRRQPRSRGRR
jgi:hypothetical protein